jgi:hypothetical protein
MFLYLEVPGYLCASFPLTPEGGRRQRPTALTGAREGRALWGPRSEKQTKIPRYFMSCQGMGQTNFPINNKKVVKLIEGCYYLININFTGT